MRSGVRRKRRGTRRDGGAGPGRGSLRLRRGCAGRGCAEGRRGHFGCRRSEGSRRRFGRGQAEGSRGSEVRGFRPGCGRRRGGCGRRRGGCGRRRGGCGRRRGGDLRCRRGRHLGCGRYRGGFLRGGRRGCGNGRAEARRDYAWAVCRPGLLSCLLIVFAAHYGAIFLRRPLVHFLICRLIADQLYGCDSGERGNFTTSASHEYSQSCSPDPGPTPTRCDRVLAPAPERPASWPRRTRSAAKRGSSTACRDHARLTEPANT